MRARGKDKSPRLLVVIPARGGSKGIPSKNLRPLSGKPLIWYSINNAKKIIYQPDIYVSTDCMSIYSYAKHCGVNVVFRPQELSGDDIPLDPVISHSLDFLLNKNPGTLYDLVITMQPTSPLLTEQSINGAIQYALENHEIDTVISACEDAHLTWKKNGEKFIPNYSRRLNRQQLPPIYRETGGFLISRFPFQNGNERIGKKVHLYVLEEKERIDIDNYEDWAICEYYLKRRKVVFVVAGNRSIGLGHVYNTLQIASYLVDQDVEFLVTSDSQLAFDKIRASNYRVEIQSSQDIIMDVLKLCPDVVINDRLDTLSSEIVRLKNAGLKVVNIEDLGSGAQYADVVINAIYPEKHKMPRHYYGHKYFLLREEFLINSRKPIKKDVKNVLITFGGVDPNNLTKLVLNAIYKYCKEQGINLKVILGFGYSYTETLSEFKDIEFIVNAKNIANELNNSDIIFTSAGRTVYEIAHLGIPCIILCQNERELSHLYAFPEHGFISLGLGNLLSEKQILTQLIELNCSYERRHEMRSKMTRANLANGSKRVLGIIRKLL